MSSESEEDFLSADEGSDFEGFETSESPKQVPVQCHQSLSARNTSHSSNEEEVAVERHQPWSSLSPRTVSLSSGEVEVADQHRTISLSSDEAEVADHHRTISLSSNEEEADFSTSDQENTDKSPSELESSDRICPSNKSTTCSLLEEIQPEEEKKQNLDKEIGAALSELSIHDILCENLKSTTDTVPKKEISSVLVSVNNNPKCVKLAKEVLFSENGKELIKCLESDRIKYNDNTKKNDKGCIGKRDNYNKLTISSCEMQEPIIHTVHAGEEHDQESKNAEKDVLHVENVKQAGEVKNTEIKLTERVETAQVTEIKESEAACQTVANQRKAEKNQPDTDKVTYITKEETNTCCKELDSGVISKPKPIRESRIGIKKPREKLRERLGTRKLGSRIEEKTLDNISCDSIRKIEDSSDKVDKSRPDCALNKERNKEKKEFISEEKEDEQKKGQEWVEREQLLRWELVHSQGGNTQEMPSKDCGDDGGWGESWSGWGSSLLSAASTFTREVGKGVGTVMETVEGTLGVPDPETLAQEIAERERKFKSDQEPLKSKVEEENQETDSSESLNSNGGNSVSSDRSREEGKKSVVDYSFGSLSSLGSLVSGVSGALETASSKVLLGGLDTLEVIGRKAMDVIQDGDPGLRKKRALLASKKPILSQVLQEARHRAAIEETEQREGNREDCKNLKITFDRAWEVTEGPVHLEALSLVAKQCESKMASMVHSLPHYLIEKINSANINIKNACELEEDATLEGDLRELVTNIVPQIGLPVQSEKINKAWSSLEETASLIQEAGSINGPATERELYTELAALVGHVTAVSHKGAELSLTNPQANTLTLAAHFKELINSVCGGVENIADQACGAITAGASAADAQVNNTITNIYLQAASGKHYLQQSMQYLSSVLQYANTKQMAARLS